MTPAEQRDFLITTQARQLATALLLTSGLYQRSGLAYVSPRFEQDVEQIRAVLRQTWDAALAEAAKRVRDHNCAMSANECMEHLADVLEARR